MAYKQKFPRVRYFVTDADGEHIGDVVAKDLSDAKVRAEATYAAADHVYPLTVAEGFHHSKDRNENTGAD